MFINASNIIHGIRLISFENTVESGEIIEGGIGYDYIKLIVISKQNYLSCQFNLFENGTEITHPDYEVEHWGTVHSHSVLLSE